MFSDTILAIIGQAAIVAVIVGISRWMFHSDGAGRPEKLRDENIYGTKWQVRAVAIGGAIFFAVLPVWMRHDPQWPFLLIFTAWGIWALWYSSGRVVTDSKEIRLVMVGYSHSVTWEDITEILIDPRRCLVLRGRDKKLSIDNRFVGRDHLLDEIRHHTTLLPPE